MSDYAAAAEAILGELIAIPSVTGSEGLMRGYLERKFRELGFETEEQHVDGDRYNIIGRIGEGPVRLMLCTHQDVIPPLDESKWRSPPFAPDVREGRIYGRGSTDAKGSLAAMMAALAGATGVSGGSVAVAAVVEEETGKSVGARKLLERYAPEMAVIGEPTGLRVAIAHKGALRPAITIHGLAAHASSPRRGINAIALAGKLVNALESYSYRISRIKDPLLGRPSSEVTVIQGGDRINVIPERCTVCIDRRLVSSETVEGAFEDLRRLVSRLAKKYRMKIDVDLLSAYPPSATDPSEAVVRLSRAALKETGLPAAPVGFPAGCDMWAFRARGIPTVVLGPGSIGQAHVIDEYLELDQLKMAVDVYGRLIRRALE
jgi:acetylornithine deacetylase/succinyl-diaminopimelate desuccinylase family protein